MKSPPKATDPNKSILVILWKSPVFAIFIDCVTLSLTLDMPLPSPSLHLNIFFTKTNPLIRVFA